MRKLIQLLALSLVMATLALPAFAQEATASPSPATTTATTAAQGDQEAKAALYKRVTDNYKTNQPVAYEAAKEYLQKYPQDDPKIIQYLQNFVAKYEKATVQNQFPQFIKDKKYTEAFALGKQILAKEPENLGVMMNLGYAGYLASFANNTAFNADAINYAKQAIQKIESGKTTDNWDPFKNKDEALAYLNYALGFMNLKTNPGEAVNYFVKAAQANSPVKNEAITYYYLALGYEVGPYKTQSEQFAAMYQGKDETPESKAALESLNQLTDRLIDAYARAVSYAGTEAKYAAEKTKWMARLTELYKFRHKDSDAGLNELIANVRNTPLPTATSAPTATTPATTPATTTSTSGTDGAATSTTPATNTGTGAATTTTPANTAQPTNSTTPTTTTPSTSTQPSSKPTTTPAPSQPADKPKP